MEERQVIVTCHRPEVIAMVNETEQWLLNGDCTKCRRNKYCSKQCTKRKRYVDREIRQFIAKKISSQFVREFIRKFS